MPRAEGGDRLSLPRLLKEGWVVIGKEEVAESKEAARQRRRQVMRSRASSSSSSGDYAWDGDREFEGHEAGGWKSRESPANQPSLHNLFNLYHRKENTQGKRGAVPVLTLFKAHQRGDAWIVKDNRPRPPPWWKRAVGTVSYVVDPRIWAGRWLWPRLVSGWRNTCEGVADWVVREFR